MSIEGQIIVDLFPPMEGAQQTVRITSTRPRDVARLFIGKRTEDVVTSMPLMFNICGAAQASVAVSACEQATAIKGNVSRDGGRALVVLAESAREHALRILLDWKTFAGSEGPKIDPKQVMLWRQQMQSSLFGSAGAFELNSQTNFDRDAALGVIKSVESFLRDSIIDETPQAWLERTGLCSFENWFRNSDGLAARFVAAFYARQWQSVGVADIHPLPVMDAGDLWNILEADRDGDFVANPEWLGEICETGPLSRNFSHPLIVALTKEFGSGILIRQIARLVELCSLPGDMRRLLNDLGASHSSMAQTSEHGDGCSLAQLETARGRLVHAVRLKDAKIANYKILAPTEWNFHANGAATSALENLHTEDSGELKSQAEQVVQAIDPCVGYEVRVH